jgi:hypothetical protein
MRVLSKGISIPKSRLSPTAAPDSISVDEDCIVLIEVEYGGAAGSFSCC